MTSLQKQALTMIQEMSDDEIIYIIDILRGIRGLSCPENDNQQKKSKMALDALKKYRGSVPSDIDEKAELASGREEKYANIN